MSLWTRIRDGLETAAVGVGNFLLPGSALVTSQLVSDGSKKQLSSDLGKAMLLGTGGAGAVSGNLANYGAVYDKVAGMAGGIGGAGSTGGLTGQAAVDAFNAGKISAAEFEALASGSGTTASSLLSGVGLGQYLAPIASAGSALLGANAATSSANTQAQAQREANQLYYQMYQEQKGLQEPYRQAGLTGQNRLMELMGLGGNAGAAGYGKYAKDFGMADYQADPGYGFRMSEGLKALERTAAHRGGLLSGATLKGAQRYGQDLASQEYQNAFNRYQTNRTNQLQTLGNLMSSGQNAASNIGSAAGSYGQQAGAGLTNVGAAQAAGTMGAANAISGGLSQYLNYDANQNMANAMRQSAYRNPYTG